MLQVIVNGDHCTVSQKCVALLFFE